DDNKEFNKLKQSARSKATRTKYIGDWRKYIAYTEKMQGFNPQDKEISISSENAEKSIAAYISWLKENKEGKKLKGKSEITKRMHIKTNLSGSKSTPPQSDLYKLSTLKRKISAIKYYYKTYRNLTINSKNKDLTDAMDGIGQEYKDLSETKKKQAFEILRGHLKIIVDSIPDDEDLTNIRDRAMILLGWWSASRRSEIFNLVRKDLTFNEGDEKSLIINIRYSKTDQKGEGETKALPFNNDAYCPYKALKKWLEIARITESESPLFYKIRKLKKEDEEPDDINRIEKYQIRGGKKISLSDSRFVWILKNRARKAGIIEWEQISGHSLRRGFITQCDLDGYSDQEIMSATNQKDPKTVQGYKKAREKKSSSPAMKMRI
ncbi:site-specific integrase, partial [Alphaproteobacteria bacterium]|nr:site-specific integrase [Alphaproteobacteria bacterium]